MNLREHKPDENKSQSAAKAISQKQNNKRPEEVAQRKFQAIADNSVQVKQGIQLQSMANNAAAPIQKQTVEEEPGLIQKKANNTGLPDNLKSGIENLSGYSMDDVKVHYNSDKPAQLQAHAYAQGTEIHLGSGQEKHLPHEAWHVVQQKQGRVQPTMQLKGNVNVNDDAGLEEEADVMGATALQAKFASGTADPNINQSLNPGILQRKIYYDNLLFEFQVDGKKPAFTGSVKAMVLLASQSRDHIIPYAAIENDLAVMLNNWIAAPLAGFAKIINFTETLFPNKGAANQSYQTMVKKRASLFATLVANTIADYQSHAMALLSALNSSFDNIRAGDATINSSVGENLDTDFLPGVYTVPVGGLNVYGNGAKNLPAGTQYLRLKPASEAVLWEYQVHTTQALSFVFHPNTNTQVSSVDAPKQVAGGGNVAGKAVIVFDPSGKGLPFYYS